VFAKILHARPSNTKHRQRGGRTDIHKGHHIHTLGGGGIVSECSTDRHTAAESLADVRRTDISSECSTDRRTAPFVEKQGESRAKLAAAGLFGHSK
jgi:hypothetical protein